MSRIRVYGVLAVLLLSFAGAVAQNATTSLRGVVRDPSGAVVPGATITLTSKASGQVLTTQSKGSGEYQLPQLAPAKYVISATAPGFGTVNKTAELLVNQPATIDFSLGVAADNTVVDVTAAAETLNMTDASLGGSADNATIQALPSETRNVPDLLSLQPGVLYLPNQGGDSRNGAVNGGRSDQGNVTLDGVDDNDQVNGYAFTGVLRETQDSIEEFRVTTGNANADAGRSSGAQVSLVTKSGTNKFHGAAYEYFRPTNTVSNDFFNKQGQLNQGIANRPPKLLRNIFGGDLGGPIFKDKLFFFANYEGSRLAESSVIVRTTPTLAYKQGNLSYTGDLPGTTTPDPMTQVLTPAQVSALDAPVCQVCNGAGGSAYTGNPGPNPNVLAYFASMPTANGTTQGDQLNEGSYTFSSPNPISLNTTIVRLDYLPSPKHRIFARGNLQKDTTVGVLQFPGQPPSSRVENNTKGMTFGDTWTISPNVVNDIRYGYIRQAYGNVGIGSGDYVDFRFLSTATAETRTTVASVPVNNIVDNFNIVAGKHNIQIGANWRLVHQNRHSNGLSFSSATSNPYWLGGGGPPDPSNIGGESVDGGFSNSYLIAYANLVGTIPQVNDQFNYHLDSAGSGTLLADGAYLDRHFSANEYEGYAQDAWRIKPNLTITAGVRYSLLQTPWETKGQEVTPTIDTDTWYKQREAAALQSQVYEPLLTFAPAGKFYNKPGFYPKQKNNIAPRFAVVYGPTSKTSIRAGAGLYYDHFGEGLVNTFDQEGSFGLSNELTNPAATETVGGSPRFLDRHTLPFSNATPAQHLTFPYTPNNTAATGFAITYGIDSKIKTPYTEAFDFSVQQQLPGGFTLETNYVGRLGRHLLQSLDIAEPTDFVDPQGGGDYYTASTTLEKIADANGQDPTVNVQPIPYFEHMFPQLAGVAGPNASATQTFYSYETTYNRTTYGGTEDIADVDFFCFYGCSGPPRFWQSQFASLYAISSIGRSAYNALQMSLHHPTSHGLKFDINYTFSKSIDWGSDTERGGPNGGNSAILNTWRPQLNRAVSDFDTRNLITADLIDQLPFGRGKALLTHAGPVTNAIIGGWQLSGIIRVSSGLPFSFYEPGYTTDWQDPSFAVVSNKQGFIKQRYFDSSGNPQYFSNPSTLNNGIYTGGPIRLPYAGEAGQRNPFRGDGYFNLDSGLAKSWQLERYGALKFAWEVYNVTNSVRFDPFSINGQLTSGSLGIASAELTQPRRMQFSLRYDF
jgi:hypothetical protein